MVTFQEESYKVAFSKHFMDMYKAHWRELGPFHKEHNNLSPNWHAYRTAGKMGNLILFTAKYKDKIIGYNLFITTMHSHYSNTKIAENDILYLNSEFRKGFIGYNFIKYCVEELKKKVDVITLTMKAEHSFEPITKRLGFNLTDCTYILEV